MHMYAEIHTGRHSQTQTHLTERGGGLESHRWTDGRANMWCWVFHQTWGEAYEFVTKADWREDRGGHISLEMWCMWSPWDQSLERCMLVTEMVWRWRSCEAGKHASARVWFLSTLLWKNYGTIIYLVFYCKIPVTFFFYSVHACILCSTTYLSGICMILKCLLS